MTALAEQLLRMGLLEIAAADLAGRNLRGDGQHRSAAAVGVEQAVDEMEVARTAGSGADGKLARDLRFARGREGSHLLMPDVNPIDGLSFSQRIGQAVQAVTDHAEDALHPGLNQCFRDQVGDIFNFHGC